MMNNMGIGDCMSKENYFFLFSATQPAPKEKHENSAEAWKPMPHVNDLPHVQTLENHNNPLRCN
jgi:hypothetical protein